MRRAGAAAPDGLQIPALSADEIDWIVAWTDANFLRDLRDKTLIVIGVALARRGIELCAFDPSDFGPPTPQGWDVMIRNSKTDIHRVGFPHYLGHLDPADEHPWCPACALAVWLHVLERRHGEPWTGPLFPSRVLGAGRPRGRLSTQDARLVLKRQWEHAGLDPSARIASRALRIGGASSAHDAGLSIAEIAEYVTIHTCLDACARYVRPTGGQFHLPV